MISKQTKPKKTPPFEFSRSVGLHLYPTPSFGFPEGEKVASLSAISVWIVAGSLQQPACTAQACLSFIIIIIIFVCAFVFSHVSFSMWKSLRLVDIGRSVRSTQLATGTHARLELACVPT